MNWKNSDLRKLIIWVLTFFEEDNGKASMKRLIAVALAANVSYAIVHCVRNNLPSIWGESITFLITIFGMIASLLAFTYIPTRKEKDDAIKP